MCIGIPLSHLQGIWFYLHLIYLVQMFAFLINLQVKFTFSQKREKCDRHCLLKFTGKHLCQSLFFNNVAGAPCSGTGNAFFTEHVWATASLLYPLLFIKSITYSLNIHFFNHYLVYELQGSE